MPRIAMLGVVSLGVALACGSPNLESRDEAGINPSRFEESYLVTPDGVRLYVRVSGSGPDTVVVPLAAWLAKDFERLTPGRTIIFFDPQGRGGSDAVDTTRLGIEQEVRDLEFVRAQLGLDRITLVGWSYLGAVVALYAADHPDRVGRVVQIGPMPPTDELAGYEGVRGSPADSTDRAFLNELVRTGRPSADPVGYCREYMMRMMIRPMMGRPEAASRTQIDPCIYWNEWPEQLQSKIRHVIPADWDYTESAARITAPVLIVHGTEDPNAPIEGGRAWAALVQRGRLVEIEGAGHAPWLEAPDELFAAVDTFLREG